MSREKPDPLVLQQLVKPCNTDAAVLFRTSTKGRLNGGGLSLDVFEMYELSPPLFIDAFVEAADGRLLWLRLRGDKHVARQHVPTKRQKWIAQDQLPYL